MTATDFTFDTPHGPVRLEMRDPVSLNPAPRNVMKHSDPEIARLVGSIGAHGFLEVPLYNEQTDRIVAGHARREAAIANHMDAIPVFVGAWDATTEDALTIALQGKQYGDWDDDALAKVLAELQEAEYDLDLTGLEPFKIEELLGQESGLLAGADPDDVPDMDAGAEPITQRGDVILLGRHRLMCGDSTSITDVERLMDGEKADMVWTDPPYGVNHAGGSKDPRSASYRSGDTIENDALSPEALEQFLRDALGNAWVVCKPGSSWYIAAPAGPQCLQFAQVLTELKTWRQLLCWVKDSFVFGRSDYHYRHESLFYGWKEGAAHHAVPDRKQDSVWEVPRPKNSDAHPTMKPVALVTRAIENSTDSGEMVLDPFGGSGTTLIACEETGRTARVMELDPVFADRILTRWQNLTGKPAVRPERVTP